MLRKNIPGGLVVTVIVLSIIGIAISLRISLDWGFYFKILSVVAVIAIIISVITHVIPSKD
ncbi:MAG: hypothetical protein ACRENO_08640 [Thermodesulfobacteriota bacterium]